MAQKFPGGRDDENRATLRRRLFQRAVAWPKRAGADTEAMWTGFPFWLRLLWIALAPLFFWGRRQRPVPRYRPDLQVVPAAVARTGRSSGTFFELALRLTDGRWQGDKPEQVAQLLVDAFLEDLRDDFRGTGWVRRYHSTFPIVLLGGISRDNGGYPLLRMIAEVRNDTLLFDPLLLITTGSRVPPLAKPPNVVRSGTADPQGLLQNWRGQMDAMSRQREIEAWLIPIVLAGPAPASPATTRSSSRS